MKIVIHIKTDNAAFQDNPDELRTILTAAVYKITVRRNQRGILMDTNGNTVGIFEVTGR